MAKASFSAYLLGRNLLKTGKKCTFRPKKARPILVVLFVPFLFPFFPQNDKNMLSLPCQKNQKSRQKTRPPPQKYTEIPYTQRKGTKLPNINILSLSCRTGSLTIESTGLFSPRAFLKLCCQTSSEGCFHLLGSGSTEE